MVEKKEQLKKQLHFKIVLCENLNFDEIENVISSLYQLKYEVIVNQSNGEIGFYREVIKE